MNHTETNPLYEQRFRTLIILRAAMALSLVTASVAVAVLYVSGSLPAAALSRGVAEAVFAVGLLLLVAAPSVKRAMLKRAEAEEGFESDPASRLSAYMKATVVSFALREAAGLAGFVLAPLTGNPWWSWGLAGGALIAMGVDRPRREDLRLTWPP